MNLRKRKGMNSGAAKLPVSSAIERPTSLTDKIAELSTFEKDDPSHISHAKEKAHRTHQKREYRSFISALESIEDGKKWGPFLELVDNPFKLISCETKIPKLISDLSGQPSQEKLVILNKALVDWMCTIKKVRKLKEGECPWLEPDTQNCYRRIFYSYMSQVFNWDYSDLSFRGIENDINDVLEKLYQERYEKWAHTGYAQMHYDGRSDERRRSYDHAQMHYDGRSDERRRSYDHAQRHYDGRSDERRRSYDHAQRHYDGRSNERRRSYDDAQRHYDGRDEHRRSYGW